MTVLELKNYLEMLCYEGKQYSMVLFVDSPLTSPLLHIEPYSIGSDTVTLCNRDNESRGLKAA
jgi:hypothetical protein